MNKIYSTLISILLFSIALRAQVRAEDFEIKDSKKKYPSALYNTIKYFDARQDTSNFGILLIGKNDIPVQVKPKVKMDLQLTKLLLTQIDTSAKKGILFLLLNEMRFSESIKNDNDIAVFQLKAKIYSVINKKCYVIHNIDTNIQASFGGDMSYMIMVSASNLISNELAKSIYKAPTDTNFVYTYNIEKLDSIEKHKVKILDSLDKHKLQLYNENPLKDGLYQTFNSFKQQIPDMLCNVIMDNDSIKSIIIINGSTVESIEGKEIYAIVAKGIGYIKINNRYRKLKKENDEFYFTLNENEISENSSNTRKNNNAIISVPISSGIIGVPGVSLALPIGLLIHAINSNKVPVIKKVKMQIDYHTGGFIIVKK
jgi:hypothetical protein